MSSRTRSGDRTAGLDQDVSVFARAVVEVNQANVQQRRICIIVLDPHIPGAINLHGAKLIGKQCEVHVLLESLLAILALPLGKLTGFTAR